MVGKDFAESAILMAMQGPFYQSRPSQSTVSVNDFLTNLERVFTVAWADRYGCQRSIGIVLRFSVPRAYSHSVIGNDGSLESFGGEPLEV